MDWQPPDWLGRLPLFSVGLVVVWTIATAGVMVGWGSQLTQASKDISVAAQFAIRNPFVKVGPDDLWVVRAVKPDFENDTVLEFMRKRQSHGEGPSPQQRFELLADNAEASFASHPFRRAGVVPSRPSAVAFPAHALLHAGVLHFALVALVFLLAAPTLERRWGAAPVAALCAVATLVAAAVFSVAHGSSDRALLGGGAAVSALVAAFVMRFRDEEIDFLAPFSDVFQAELSAPAWLLAVVWGAVEMGFWWAIPSALPQGVDHAVGYSAHAAGALVGLGAPIAMAKLGRDEAPAANAAPRQRKQKVPAFDLSKAIALREAGDEEGALALLETELRRSARNRDAVMLHWEIAKARGVAHDAAPFVAQLLDEELRRGAETVAVGLWRGLCEQAPKAPLDPARLVRLAPAIARVEGRDATLLALRQTLTPENTKGLTAPIAAQVARMALEIEPKLAQMAARRALDSFDLEPREQEELEMLAQALAPEKKARPKADAPSSVLFDETDRSAFGEVADLSELDQGFPDGAISEGVPTASHERGLRLSMTGDQQVELDFGQIRAVSVAGVRGLGPKPVLLFDLLVGGAGCERPLSLIRVRCDRFDPARLVEGATGPLDGLRKLVALIARRSEAQLMPGGDGGGLGKLRTFDSVEAYHEEVLRPAGQKLA